MAQVPVLDGRPWVLLLKLHKASVRCCVSAPHNLTGLSSQMGLRESIQDLPAVEDIEHPFIRQGFESESPRNTAAS